MLTLSQPPADAGWPTAVHCQCPTCLPAPSTCKNPPKSRQGPLGPNSATLSRVVWTAIAEVRDWKAIRCRHQALVERLEGEMGALSFRTYRNVNNASQLLIIAAFPDYDTLREIVDGRGNGIGLLLEAGAVDERIWEATGWDVLDS